MKDFSICKQLFKQSLEAHHPLSVGCWIEIEQSLTLKKLSKTQHFSVQGQYNRELAFFCEGVARVYYLTDKGTEVTKYFVTVHEFMTASLEPKLPSVINIQSLTDSTYLSIAYDKFEQLLERYLELSLITKNLLLSYFGRKQKREISLLANSAIENYQLFLEEYPDLEKHIPHYYIASYLGITPTQLSRIRKIFSAHQQL